MHICSGLPYILPAYSYIITAFIQYFMHSVPCFLIPSCITIRKTPLLRILAAVAVRKMCGHNAQHSRTVAAVSAALWAVPGWGCTLKRDQYCLFVVYLFPFWCLFWCLRHLFRWLCDRMLCSMCVPVCPHIMIYLLSCSLSSFPVYSLCNRLSLFPVCCLVLSCSPSLRFSLPCFLLFCVSL